MSLDITSLVIKTESNGIDAAANSLNKLVEAADKAEKAVGGIGKTSEQTSKTNAASVSDIDKLLQRYQKQADLLGATIAQQNAYNVAAKGGSDTQQSVAAGLGSQVDAYKALAAAQSEAISMNKALDKAYKAQQEQQEALVASQAKYAAQMQALNDAGYRAQEYKKLQDAMKELEAETRALAAEEAKRSMIQQKRDMEMYTAQVKALSDAQKEATRVANEKAVAESRAAKASAETFNAIGPSRANLDAFNKSGEQFIANLKAQTETLGYTAKQLRDFQVAAMQAKAAQLGVSEAAAPMIQAFKESTIHMGHATSGAAGIGRELLVLGHELSQGQFSRFGGSLIVLAERINFIPSLLEKVSNAAAAMNLTMAQLLTGIGLVVVALGTITVAAINAAHNFSMFNNALVLTGGYVGTTVSGLNELAISAAKAGGSLSTARELVAELASTGKFSASQIGAITPALVELEHATGSAQEGVKSSFISIAEAAENTTARSSDAVYRAVLKMNSQYHLLSTEQMEIVRQTEAQGKALDASAYAFEHMADVIKQRSHEAIENFTPFGKFLNELKKDAESLWESFTKLFATRMPNVADQIKEIRDKQSLLGKNSQVDLDKFQEYERQIAKILSDEQQKLQAAQKAGEEARLATQEQFAARSVDVAIKSANKKYAAQAALDDFAQSVSKMKDSEKRARAKEIAETWVALELATHDKIKKAKAIGFADINAEVSAIKNRSQVEIEGYSEQIVAVNQAANARKIDVMTQQSQISNLLDLKTKALEIEQNAVMSAIAQEMQVRGRSETEKKELLNRYLQASTDFGSKISIVQKERIKNENLTAEAIAKTQAAEQTDADKTILTIQKRTDLIQAKVDAYNNLPDAVKRAGVTEKQMADEVTKAQILALERKRDVLEELAGTTMYDAQAVANYTRQIQELQKEGAAQAQLEAQQLANKAALDYVTAWKQMNKQIGDDLATAIIDGGGKGWKKLINDMKLAFAKLILQPILAPISAGFADMFTTTGASSSGAALKSIDVAASASKLYSSLTAGLSNIGTYVANGVQSALYAAGLSKNLLSNGSVATGAGALASVGASAFGGLTLGNAISGGFGSNSLVNLGTGAGAVASIASSLGLIGSAGGPLTALIGGAIGGLLNRAFGMGSKNVTTQGISGTIADSGVSGQSYADWTQKGGWFRSDKSGRDSSALGADVINSFTSGLTTLKATSSDFAKNLNVSSDALKDYSKSFDIQFVGLKEVKGTAAEQAAIIESNSKIQQEAVAKFFTEMGDDMATKLIPNIQEFAKSGETASVTLQRLSDTFAATNQVANILGKDLSTAFGGIGLESAKARQYLIDLAGGVSTLNSQVATYASDFLTDAEKLAPVQTALTKAMTDLGYGSITTVEGFKALVSSLNLADQGQAQLFESLMKIAPAFKQVADAADTAAKAQADLLNKQLAMKLTIAQLSGDTAGATAIIAQQRQIEIAALDATLQPLQQRINLLNDEAAIKAANTATFNDLKSSAQGDFNVLSKSIAKAKADAQAAYDAQAATLNAQITALQATSTSITQLVSSLDSALNTLLTNTAMGMSEAAAKATLDSVLATAKSTGVLPTADSLKDTLAVLSKGDSSKYSSYEEYIKDTAITAGKMAELRDLSKAQGTVADQQLQAAKDQLAFAKTSLDAELAKYDLMLSTAQQQLDALNNNTVAVKSVADALGAFIASSGKAIGYGISTGNLTSGTPAATQDQITSLYQSLLNRAPDAGGLQFYLNNAQTKGTTALEIAQSILSSSEYASLHVNGSHANGLDNVPFDGYTAKLHKGEMVLPAKQAHNVAQADDIAELVQVMKEFKEENGTENRSLVSDIRWIKKLFQNLSPNGQTLQVTQTTIS